MSLETDRQRIVDLAGKHRWDILGRGSSLILRRGRKQVTVMFGSDARVVAVMDDARPVGGPGKFEAVERLLRKKP